MLGVQIHRVVRPCLAVGLFGLLGLVAGCGIFTPLEVAEDVDLERYAGKWYEVARYPNWFQSDDCQYTTAEYAVLDDGTVTVDNRCEDPETGEVQTISGTARVPDPAVPAKLKVRFFPLFEANYWILDLDTENYEWAVVGEPFRLTFWILSRTPTIDEDVYQAILDRMPEWGYDPDRLILTEQEAGE